MCIAKNNVAVDVCGGVCEGARLRAREKRERERD